MSTSGSSPIVVRCTIGVGPGAGSPTRFGCGPEHADARRVAARRANVLCMGLIFALFWRRTEVDTIYEGSNRMFTSVQIIGHGRVGSALAARLRERGLELAASSPELVVLCVPDRAISSVASLIAPGPWIAHV